MNLSTDAGKALAGLGAAVAAILGFVLHHQFEPDKQLCNSGVGSFGQAVSNTALKDCTGSTTLADIGMVLLVVALLTLASSVIGLTFARGRTQSDRWKDTNTPGRQ